MCSSISDNFPEELSGLINSVLQQDHSLINEDIRLFNGAFSPRAAFYLLSSALVENLPLKTFEAILERSPPVPELFSDDDPSAVIFRDNIDLIERLARMDRADVLAMLLERGASPNRVSHHEYGLTPLLEALTNGSLKSLEILLQHPGLDTTWTGRLLLEWAAAECAEPRQQQCLRAMAPRFTGREAPPDRPLPIPEPMTAHIIALVGNWSLLERFCRERGRVSPEDGQRAFGQMSLFVIGRYFEEEDRSARAAALAALLEICPDLLGPEKNCRALLRCFLDFGEAGQKHLRPWVEGLGRYMFAAEKRHWLRVGYDGFPDYWRKLLPNGPTLAVDRWDGFWASGLTGENLGNILDSCPILGDGRKGELSPVAQAALRLCGSSLIDSLFQHPNALLATEDPGALADFVLKENLPRATRAAVLSHVHKEMDYDL